MCGIVGYLGSELASKKLFYGLQKLEYRGYDSAGIALQDDCGKIDVVRSSGRLNVLEKKFLEGKTKDQFCGIGHTRWATHGKANETNAHPHFSDDKSVAIVHNGIIENYKELKDKLTKKGYRFYSDTDTEVLAKLIHYYLCKYKKPLDALARVCLRVVGSYAVCILLECAPNEIYCIKKDSPLVVCKKQDGVVVASDVNAIEGKEKDVCYIENSEMVKITKDGYYCYTIDQEPIKKQTKRIVALPSDADKCGYAHFMLKEINEQPMVIKRLIRHYYQKGKIAHINLDERTIQKLKHIHIVACGSAYNAGLVGARVIEDLCKTKVSVHLASEWRYQTKVVSKGDLMVFVSQSGETADTLFCLKQAKQSGQKTAAIVNVFGSSISRECDLFLPTLAGTEVAVATTKAYLAQTLVFHFLALKIAKIKGFVSNSKLKSYILKICKLSASIKKCLSCTNKIQQIAQQNYTANSIFFLGRKADYDVCCEANLKCKEISYIHSEAYAAGELKHGSISLVENGSLVVGVVTDQAVFEKTISNLVEVKSRGAKVVVFSSLSKKMFVGVADEFFAIPKTFLPLQPMASIVPLQLFAYFVALARGCNIDKPRNLAKSVTVE